MTQTKRIAFLGILIESNKFAPLTGLEDFKSNLYLHGDQSMSLVSAYELDSVVPTGYEAEFVPILVAAAESGGPVIHEDYLELIGEIESRLKSAGQLDGVFIFAHGAGQTSELADMDGDYFYRIRRIVGADVPIVAELDLHANLSDTMVDAVDILVGYRTNPHVDIAERARECIAHLFQLIDGQKVFVAHERLPLSTAQIAQLTAHGTPYGDVMQRAAEMVDSDTEIANITLLSGFTFGDTAYNGFSVLVSSWRSDEHAIQICESFAQQVWADRYRFIAQPASITEAVDHETKAQSDQSIGPRIYADLADNPGGGGRGNTLHLLRAMTLAGLKGIQASAYFDPALVKQARRAGQDSFFKARFNTEEDSPFSGTWTVEARVERLFEGKFQNGPGVRGKRVTDLGECCLLSLNAGRVHVVISSNRHQVLNPAFFTSAGLNPEAAHALIVKSRGHFRAGFEHIATGERVIEVDGPGLVTADLGSVDWRNLPRPSFPLDPDARWTPTIRLRGQSEPPVEFVSA